jgi:DNA-binding FrmR family transcriptional regulator
MMPGYLSDKPALQTRLRRIEGQVRGIERMIDSDTYCIEILNQISAATRALEAVAVALLEGHLNHCVHDAIITGGAEADEKLREATVAIRRLLRS